jgi:Glycosyl hydrolase family 12/Cellulose binding domain
MRQIRGLAAIAGLLIGAAAFGSFGIGAARADTVICDTLGTTTIQNRYEVMNNNWGDTTTQCITVTSTGFAITTASHNKPTNGAPGSYPAVYYGCHWGTCSPGTVLPKPASSESGIQTSVSMSYPTSGTYDAAYDIWYDPTARTNGQNTGAEIMIWLNKVGSIQPIGSVVATVSLAGATWNVWEGVGTGNGASWNVISYVRTSTTSSAGFAPSTFFNYAVSRGYAQSSWYLTSIQAGFEPWVGGTGLAVNNFSVSGETGGGTTTTPTTSTPTTPAGGTSSCSAAYAVANSWSGGFVSNVTGKAGSAAISTWKVTLTLPSGTTITSLWGGINSGTSGSVTVANASYNGMLGAGASTSFGFQGTGSGSGVTAACTAT